MNLPRPPHKQNGDQPAQGLAEFALLIALIAIVALVSLALLGPSISESFQAVLNGLSGNESPVTFLTIKNDFLNRINAFYQENGRWPRSWGSYAFTDIGLDPDDWSEPVEGIRWGPHGKDVALGTNPEDPYVIYINTLSGQTLRLYDGWRIWCVAGDGKCYYHVVSPENEVDITTLKLVPR